jgi:ABC-type microcin C transport system duplicated ATPase subunit YejF
MIQQLRCDTDRLLADYRHSQQSVRDEKSALKDIAASIINIEAAQKIIQTVAQQVQRQAHLKIAGIVTRCLEAVWGEEAYKFQIDFVQKRGKTEVELLFLRNGKEIDPTEAAGGGPLEIASFALRLTAVLLSMPRKRRLIVMDEPFKAVHESVQPKIPTMLETLAKEMGFQFIFVTNSKLLETGKVVRLGE